MHVFRGQSRVQDISFIALCLIPLRQDLSLEAKLEISTVQAGQQASIIHQSLTLDSRITDTYINIWRFMWGNRESNSNLHVCANALISSVSCLAYLKGCCIKALTVCVVTGNLLESFFQKMKNRETLKYLTRAAKRDSLQGTVYF